VVSCGEISHLAKQNVVGPIYHIHNHHLTFISTIAVVAQASSEIKADGKFIPVMRPEDLPKGKNSLPNLLFSKSTSALNQK
jgi:hypothetical protein